MPDCLNKSHPHECHPAYVKRYGGYCFACHNAGVPKLLEDNRSLAAMLASELTAVDISEAIASEECRKLAELAQGKVVLEIGSQHGSSTVSMAQTAKLVVAVDWHRGDEHAGGGDTLFSFWRNARAYRVSDRVIPVVGKYEQIMPFLAHRQFDMVFIDAQHHYEDARRHVLMSVPLLMSPGGLIVVHDYGWPKFPGVKQAVDELVAEADISKLRTVAWFTGNSVRGG